MEQKSEISLNAIKAFIINHRINDYAVERVAFGFDKIGDMVPLDVYERDIWFGIDDVVITHKVIPGVYINELECISAEHDHDELVRDLFILSMEKVFMYAPKDKRLERGGEELPLLPSVREYVFGLLPLFSEVLKIEVEYDAFDNISTDKAQRMEWVCKWNKFVTEILLKPIKSGSKINRYVKDFTCMPHFVNRLIERIGNDFYLKCVDITSYEYIFALFSMINFINVEHCKLLELKMLEWERINSEE